MNDESPYIMLNYHYDNSEYEAEEFCGFVEEYGWRKNWGIIISLIGIGNIYLTHWNEKEERKNSSKIRI